MRRLAIAIALALGLAFTTPPDAAAFTAGCLPGGLPTTPGSDAVGRTFQRSSFPDNELFRVDVWRVACADDPNQVALLLKATPVTQGPFVCSISFDLIQGGQQMEGTLRQTPSSFISFCSDLLVPSTFSLERQSGPAFDPKGAFTLVYDGGGSFGNQRLEVPAGGGIPQLHITVVSTGCNPCSAGQTAAFHIHVVNPGPPIGVELKTGLRFPDNGLAFSLLGVHLEDVLESGEFDIPLANIVVPGEVPNGAYHLEAAILEPIFGVTLSRHAIAVTKQ